MINQWEWVILLILLPLFMFPEGLRSLVLLVIPMFWGLRLLAGERLVPTTPYNGSLLVLLVMVGIGLITSYDPLLSGPKAAGVLLGVALMLATTEFSRRSSLWSTVVAFLAIGVAMAIIGLFGSIWAPPFDFLNEARALLTVRVLAVPGTVGGRSRALAPSRLLARPFPGMLLQRLLPGRRPGGRLGGPPLRRFLPPAGVRLPLCRSPCVRRATRLPFRGIRRLACALRLAALARRALLVATGPCLVGSPSLRVEPLRLPLGRARAARLADHRARPRLDLAQTALGGPSLRGDIGQAGIDQRAPMALVLACPGLVVELAPGARDRVEHALCVFAIGDRRGIHVGQGERLCVGPRRHRGQQSHQAGAGCQPARPVHGAFASARPATAPGTRGRVGSLACTGGSAWPKPTQWRQSRTHVTSHASRRPIDSWSSIRTPHPLRGAPVRAAHWPILRQPSPPASPRRGASR